ncbi:MAG: hypothetical protein V1911_00190 [Candidatus Micrarchaeota archaeon]
MVKFTPTCRECFHKFGLTILLKETNGEWICPRDRSHVTKDDVQVV